MKLTYNAVALHDLGAELIILGQTSVLEPAEAPQRRITTLRCRLECFEPNWEDNYAAVTALRTALKTQQGVLRWQDDADADLLNRRVTVGPHDLPEEFSQGTYHQGIHFSFTYEEADLTTQCLSATFQRSGAGTPLVTLTAVEKWGETAEISRAHPRRDARTGVRGGVTASGYLTTDTTQTLADSRTALLAAKDQLVSELQGSSGTLAFGTFQRTVRIGTVRAEVNQAMHRIEWGLTAEYTLFPTESDYALSELQITRREQRGQTVEGLTELVLSGRIEAPSAAAALAKLALWRTALVPAGYVCQTLDSAERRFDNTVETAAFLELNFTETYRLTPSAQCTLQWTSGPLQTLGPVDTWVEAHQSRLVSDLRSHRQRASGTVTLTGSWQGGDQDTATTLEAVKQAWLTQLAAHREHRLRFLTFDRTVRVLDFRAEVLAGRHAVAWSLTGEFTRFPDETNYAWVDMRLAYRDRKDQGAQGEKELAFTGRIEAPTLGAAQAKLAALQAAVAPAGYTLFSEETDERRLEADADGVIFIELAFALTYRQDKAGLAVYTPTGGAAVTLGAVDRFSDSYEGQLFAKHRSHREHAGGTVSLGGRSQHSTYSTAQLYALRDAWMAALTGQKDGTLAYGSHFSQVVRVTAFRAEVQESLKAITWTLEAGYTRFPNEAGYAVCDFRLNTKTSVESGEVELGLTGRIDAQSLEAATAKLAALRAALVPAGYAPTTQDTEERRVEGDTDGATFVELTFSDVYKKTSASAISKWTLRRTDEDDVRAGLIHTSYSGSVTAKGATAAAAEAEARALAATLGDAKYPFQVRGVVTLSQNLNQSGGVYWVTVDFQYDYQRKGEKVYLEVTSSASLDTFGSKTARVSGMVVAPTEAAARAAYETDVRHAAVRQSLLILSEETAARTQTIRGVESQEVSLEFSLVLQVDRTAGEVGMTYALDVAEDFVALEKTSSVQGVIYAASEAAARAFRDTYLATLSLGTRTRRAWKTQQQTGPKPVGASLASGLVSCEFSETYTQPIDAAGGASAILQCELTEELQYAGHRWVPQPVPDGPSVIQWCGYQEGARRVRGSVRALTQAAAEEWIWDLKGTLIEGTYEQPPQFQTTYELLPLRRGVLSGAGSTVRCVVVQFAFAELLPDTYPPG